MVVAASAALVAVLAGCSGKGEAIPAPAPDTAVRATTVLAVDQLAPAVAAVEAARGGPQRYTEVNANADGVSLFVVVDDQHEAAYFFRSGALEAPGEPVALSATPFTLAGVDPTSAPELVRGTQQRFPGAQVTALALVQPSGRAPVWALKCRSARGGVLDVVYSATGVLVSVSPAG